MKTAFPAFGFALLALSGYSRIVFDAPGHVYTHADAPVARGGVAGETCSVEDWRGRRVLDGMKWRPDGTLRLPVMPEGYYRLESAGAEASFAVVPAPERRVRGGRPFYCVDSAQSGISLKGCFECPWNGGDTFMTVSDLVRKAGVSRVRERMRWNGVNPEKGRYDYSYYMYNADLLSMRGVSVLGMFHDAPQWAGRLRKLPSDLGAVFTFCRDTARAFAGRMDGWEFWNEQDLPAFAPEPVWDYAAALKAAYLGFKAGRPGGTVLPGGLGDVSPYSDVLLANDAGKFADVFSFHTYLEPVCYPEVFGRLRGLMEKYGIADRAVWVTESGCALEGNAEEPSVKKGIMQHSRDQELVVAEFYAKAQIAMQMEGVDRNYHFVFGAYTERNGTKDWGVMRRDGTVKPCFAAISSMTMALASARLAGKMHAGEGLEAYLFEHPDGSQSVAFWSVSPVDTQKGGRVRATPDFAKRFALDVGDGRYLLRDMCGSCREVAVENGVLDLEATRFPAYVSGLHGLEADVPPRPRGAVRPYVPGDDEDLSVVLRIDLDRNDFVIGNHNSRADMKGASGRLRIQAWNLGDCVKTGRIEAAGSKLEGLPRGVPVILPPHGKAPAQFDCRLWPDEGEDPFQSLVLTGVFGRKRSSRLFLPVCVEKKLLASSVPVPLDWADPGKWLPNTNADSSKVSWDEAEKAVRFDYRWSTADTGRWFYPVYALDRGKENPHDAHSIEFEIKTVQNKFENDFVTQYLMLQYAEPGRRDRYIGYQAPIANWEKRYVSLEGEDGGLAGVKALRIGANPKGTECTLWLRNVRILRRGKR